MALAEESLDHRPGRRFVAGLGIALLLAVLVTLAVLGIRMLLNAPAEPKRQVAKISILPDTPPPPPPPPREEPRKPEPKDEPRQVQQQEQPKPQQAPPAEAPIKMEGAAGSGDSPFAAGTVTQDYKGGPVQTGPVPAASAPATVADRAAERFYANSARQLLRDEIERQLRPEAGELTVTFAVWIDAEGRIRRHELAGTGDAARDADLQAALDATSRALRLPPPGALAQPMRFRLTVRPQG